MRKYLGASVIITVTALGSGDSDYGVRSFSGTTQIRNSRITGEDYTLAGDF